MAKRKTTDTIVVHCAATKASMDIGASDIDRWHRARGFFMCGYHVVIRRDGTVEKASKGHKCRALDDVGAHAEGFNSTSVGVCLVGGLADDGKTGVNNFTNAQFSALVQVIKELKVYYPRINTVLGHRDLPKVAKDCPCFDVREWLETNLL